jgi:acyl-coenzyme A thioesterase PaaI-like protein
MENWPKLDLNTQKGYDKCFGCGKANPIGLKLKFAWDGKTARAEFTPRENLQGWPDYLHGGITACALDEAMTWTAKLAGTNSVTAKMGVRFRKMVPIEATYIIACTITRQTSRLIETAATLTGQDGEIFAEATSTQFVVNNQEESHR